MAKKLKVVGNPDDPFVQRVHELLTGRANLRELHGQQETRQAEGYTADLHIGRAYRWVPQETVNSVLAGTYVPTLTEISDLALDCGLVRGQSGYSEVNRLGEAYRARYHHDNKDKELGKGKREEKSVPAEVVLLKTFHEALAAIRKSRYYYPYGEYSMRPLITQEIYDALPRLQKTAVKHPSKADVGSLISGYTSYENSSFPTALKYGDIVHHLRLSPEEKKTLDVLLAPYQIASEIARVQPDHVLAFKRYRRKSNLSKAELAADKAISLVRIENIEAGTCPEELFQGTLRALGFNSINKFLAYEAKMPNHPQNTQVDPEHAAALKRYRLKRNLSQERLARMSGHPSASAIDQLEYGERTQQYFNDTIRKLGFSSPEAFLEVEAQLPENDASRNGHIKRGGKGRRR